MSEDRAFDELHPDAYRLLVEGVPAMLYIDRPDQRSTNAYTSPQVERLLGYPRDEWAADPDLWRRSLHPDDAERVLEANRDSNERGARFLAEYRLRAADGRWVWIRDEAIPMSAPDGTITFWRGVMLDITDRKEAEDEGRLAQERLRALIDNIPAVVYVETRDASAEGFFLSGYVETLFGYTAKDWTWTDDFWIDRVHPDDRDEVLAADAASDATLEPYAVDYRFLAADGRWVWIRDEASFVRTEDGVGFWQGFMFDITERKEAEGRLRWSLDVLRQTLQQRRELAQRVQHAQEEERRRIAADLHDDPIQVMSAVDMRLQMLAGFPESVTHEELAALEADVRGAIERLRSMLFELRPAALDLEGIVPALEQYLEHVAATTGWSWEVQGGVMEEPDSDVRALLYRIAQEAIQNAGKHAGATRVRVDVATAGDGVTLRIHDDGAGFDPDEAARPEPGHLGMSTMLESAELAGGWVRVASSFGEGTTVECWLPLDASTERVSEDV